MIPVYEQGSGHGIGLMLEPFLTRVRDICAGQIGDGRARAMAIIFRDAQDRDLKRILTDQGAFAKLDRLSGRDLSVFFVHTASDEALARFNRIVGAEVGLGRATLPTVAFFRTAIGQDGSVGLADVEITELPRTDIVHGLHDLYRAIERYLTTLDRPPQDAPRLGGKARAAGRFVSLELFRAALREGIGVMV